jgi:DNA-binding SARP family transcriptional activator
MSTVRANRPHHKNTARSNPSLKSGCVDQLLEHNHLCVFYHDNKDLSRRCVALAQSGITAGFRCLFVFNNAVSSNIAVLFGDAARESGSAISADELMGLHSSPVAISAAVKILRDRSEQACSEGYRGLFILLDMSWMLVTPSGLANQIELEAALHELGQVPSLRIVCLYSRSLFPANILLDALRTHAAVLDDGACRSNPYFIPPAIYLSGDAQQELDWRLAALHDANLETITEFRPARTTELPLAKAMHSRRKDSGDKAYGTRSCIEDDIEHVANPGLVPGGADRWKIRCLGNLRVYRQDGSAVEWNRCSGATYKTKTLFAYLLGKGAKGASVEEIADLLWPEAKDLDQSLNRLYHTVHCLRLALSPTLSSSHDSPYVVSHSKHYYLMLPDATWVDVPMFEQFCRQGEKLLNAGDIEQSLLCHHAAERLYTGSLFADIPREYVEDRDRDWCWSRRFWLESIYLKMLTYMVTIHRRRDDTKLALQYCDRVLKIDPCSERAHQEAMITYHLIGRKDALERQYRLCRESLKRYEERQPSPGTISLARQLMA